MFDQHDNILVNNTGSVAGLNFLVNLQKVGTVQVMPQEKSFNTPPGTMVPDFMKGTTAMIFDGPQDIKEIMTGSGSVFTGKHGNHLGIAAIPTGLAGQTGSPLGGESYVISAGTAHPAEAYKFIKFMSLKSRSQVALANAGDALPTLQSAQDTVSSYPFVSTFFSPSIKDTVVAPPPRPFQDR